MEIKVTFRFDASESLLSCVDNFRKAMEAMAASGGLSILPATKEAGIVKAIATEDGVTVNKKEQIWPPKGENAPTAVRKDESGTTAQEESEAPSEAVKTPSVSDMREAVNKLRSRIEGEV